MIIQGAKDFAKLEESFGQNERDLTAKTPGREGIFAFLSGEIHRREREEAEFTQRDLTLPAGRQAQRRDRAKRDSLCS